MRSVLSSCAMARGELPVAKGGEDAADHRRLYLVDNAPAANGVPVRVELTDDIVSIAQAATGATLAHSAFKSAPHLLA